MNTHCLLIHTIMLPLVWGATSLPASAQCAEVEAVLKDIVSQEIRPRIIAKDFDTYEKLACYTLDEMKVDDFILLGRGLEYSDLIQLDPSTVEYDVLRMVYREKGVACEHIFIRRRKQPATLIYHQSQRKQILYLLKAKQEALATLKRQQQYLTTDILNILGDVLVGQIEAPGPFSDVVSKASKELKERGIVAVSRYYDLDYKPSENENANLVRKVLDPIDKVISATGVQLGTWLKYWETIKLSPDAGMVVGNAAAKVRIYLMESELEDDIKQLQKQLDAIPASSN